MQQSNNIENLSLKELQFEQAQKVIQPIEAPLRTFYLSTVICNDCLIYVKFIQKKKIINSEKKTEISKPNSSLILHLIKIFSGSYTSK